MLFISGCAPQSSNETLQMGLTPDEVRITQSERTAMFGELVGRGVVEFHWTDDDGKHRNQGDLDFWKKGNAISLRVSKLGDLIMWFGGKDQEYWLFELSGDETKLTIGGDALMFRNIDVALVLLGLAPLPEGMLSVNKGIVSLQDNSNRLWEATFDPSSHRPLEMSVIDGKNKSIALHRRDIRVEIDNRHEVYWPVTGGLIDLFDTRGDTKIKIAFSALSTIVENEPMERVCNLEYLRKALKPTMIVEDTE